MLRSNQPHYVKARKERVVTRLEVDIKKYRTMGPKDKLEKAEKHLENLTKLEVYEPSGT